MEGKDVLIHIPEFVLALPFLLYAETHYRFKYFFSFLRKLEPELIADAPHRVEPGIDIPLLILVKDAHTFPATLQGLRILVSQHEKTILETELLKSPVDLKDPLWRKVFTVPRNGMNGWASVDVAMTITTKGRSRTYHTDNHRTSSHSPLRIYLSPDPLPREQKLYYGDAHTHSDRTDDQVEFGVPIQAAVALSKSIGLSFFCVADHSYDLDDSLHDFSVNDPAFPKWNSLLREIDTQNSNDKNFVVVQGEEVSCRNQNERNVHFLIFGSKNFLEGSGDGAERWLQTRCEHSIREILEQKDPNALAFAAHPMEDVPLLQRFLLGRGSWSMHDFDNPRLTGIQFANGMLGNGFLRGFDAWKQCLLRGQRFYCLAGNDAHGNFNRFRQVGIPFLAIRERDQQLFGKMRTAVFHKELLDQTGLLKSLGEGRFIITDGPVANIVQEGSSSDVTSIGEELEHAEVQLILKSQSTNEFGEIKSIKVWMGVIGEHQERLLVSEAYDGVYEIRKPFQVSVSARSYIRAEVHTSEQNDFDHRSHFCFTNPVWFAPRNVT